MKKYRILLWMLCAAGSAHGKVTLPAFFTNNMVVQQQSVLTLPGKAKAGKKVTVTVGWDDKEYVAKAAKDGTFKVEIPTPSAGGPYRITVSDGEKLVLDNVMAGEVWLCSGQSNMEMPLAGWGKVKNYEQEIADARYPSIRLLQVKRTIAFAPKTDTEVKMGGWQECGPATVPEFSAAAYFYARRLWEELNVPVGVINCSWGGTPAETWTSYRTLRQVMGFEKQMSRMADAGFEQKRLIETYRQEVKEWMEPYDARDAGMKDGKPQWISALQTGAEWKTMQLPGLWEKNGMGDFDGTVWFQKEVDMPAGWAGKDVVLSLAKIDDDDVTYFNGQEVGTTAGCNLRRMYTIPAARVKAGKGIITIRAIDYSGGGGVYGDPEQMYLECAGEKISLAGNWNYHAGVSMAGALSHPQSPEGDGWPTACYPTVLYNAMIHPFTIFPIRGVIWYQGEHNVGRAEQYRMLFQSLIMDWRRAWKQDFPFYFVQLANHRKREAVQPDSQWAALRDAQAHALHLPHTEMACAIDIGETHDIHPKNKQEVGRRLAQAALARTYGKGTYEVPAYVGYRISGRTLILDFDSEVVAHGDTPEGFILAGPDGKYHPAQAVIKGKAVILQCPEVEIPVAARYAWADNPACNLYGRSGLPVPPFRTRE